MRIFAIKVLRTFGSIALLQIFLFGLAGCARTQPISNTLALPQDQVPSESLWEEAVIQVDHGGVRRHLAFGWDSSGIGEENYIWSRGMESGFEFDLLRLRDLELRLRCRCLPSQQLPPQEVTLSIGNSELGRFIAGSEFKEYSFRIPASMLKEGRNILRFHYSWARSPHSFGQSSDYRRLAIALGGIEFYGATPSCPPEIQGDEISLPPGSELRWAFFVNPGAILEADGIDAQSDSGRLLLSLVDEHGRRRKVGRWKRGKKFRAQLPVDRAGPCMLSLRCPADRNELMDWVQLRGLRLSNPGVPENRKPEGLSARPSKQALPRMNGANVVIYLVDALRADHLGTYGYSRPTSPQIDAFARSSLVFEQAWANSSWTRPAVASILSGLRTEVHGVNGRGDILPEDLVMLPEILEGYGYQTAAIVANPNVSAMFGFHQGFRAFQLLPVSKRRSGDLHDAVSSWLHDVRDGSKPFFLYLHTVDPHLPYEPPEEERRRFVSRDARRDLGSTAVVGALNSRRLENEGQYAADLMDLYDAEIAANDRQFGRLLSELEKLGLTDRTVVIFLADHGEEFFDHGGWLHGNTLYSEVLRIPLMMRIPGARPERISMPVQQVDIMPTLLDLLGIPGPKDLQGVSLEAEVPVHRRLGAYLDLDGAVARSVVQDGWHALQWGRAGYLGSPELYRIDVDARERHDLAAGGAAALPAALLSLDRRLMRRVENSFAPSSAQIDEKTRKELEALGYLH